VKTQMLDASRTPPAPSAPDFVAVANAIYTLCYRDLIRFFRDKSRIVGSLSQPILFLLVFGSGLALSVGQMDGGQFDLNYLQFIFPGIVAMAILFTAIFGAISIIWDREFGFLKEMLVAPVLRWSLAGGETLGAAPGR
jgi:ABC-2 type transport system permease protein